MKKHAQHHPKERRCAYEKTASRGKPALDVQGHETWTKIPASASYATDARRTSRICALGLKLGRLVATPSSWIGAEFTSWTALEGRFGSISMFSRGNALPIDLRRCNKVLGGLAAKTGGARNEFSRAGGAAQGVFRAPSHSTDDFCASMAWSMLCKLCSVQKEEAALPACMLMPPKLASPNNIVVAPIGAREGGGKTMSCVGMAVLTTADASDGAAGSSGRTSTSFGSAGRGVFAAQLGEVPLQGLSGLNGVSLSRSRPKWSSISVGSRMGTTGMLLIQQPLLVLVASTWRVCFTSCKCSHADPNRDTEVGDSGLGLGPSGVGVPWSYQPSGGREGSARKSHCTYEQ